jgi:hypothetical protein
LDSAHILQIFGATEQDGAEVLTSMPAAEYDATIRARIHAEGAEIQTHENDLNVHLRGRLDAKRGLPALR